MPGIFWEPWEDMVLRDTAQGLSMHDKAELLGRTLPACKSRRYKLDNPDRYVYGRAIKQWTDEDIRVLREVLSRGSFDDAADALKRTRATVKQKAYVLGIRPAYQMKVSPKRGGTIYCKRWTEEEDNKLIWMAGVITQKEAARRLGRPLNAVKHRCFRMGLQWYAGYVSPSQLAEELGYTKSHMLRLLRELVPGAKWYTHAQGRSHPWRLTDEQLATVRAIATLRRRKHLWRKLRASDARLTQPLTGPSRRLLRAALKHGSVVVRAWDITCARALESWDFGQLEDNVFTLTRLGRLRIDPEPPSDTDFRWVQKTRDPQPWEKEKETKTCHG